MLKKVKKHIPGFRSRGLFLIHVVLLTDSQTSYLFVVAPVGALCSSIWHCSVQYDSLLTDHLLCSSSAAGPRMWNNLPVSLRHQEVSCREFKKNDWKYSCFYWTAAHRDVWLFAAYRPTCKCSYLLTYLLTYLQCNAKHLVRHDYSIARLRLAAVAQPAEGTDYDLAPALCCFLLQFEASLCSKVLGSSTRVQGISLTTLVQLYS